MKNNLVIFIGVVVIIVAGIFAFTWYKIDSNRQTQKADAAKKVQQVDLSSQAKDNLDSSLLQSCLDDATSKYPWENLQADIKRDPSNTQQYTDLYYKMKGEEEASCKLRYAN